MKVLSLAIIALLGSEVNGFKLRQTGQHSHACDYLEENGDEIDTSLAVQLDSQVNIQDEDDSVEGARAKFAAMQ